MLLSHALETANLIGKLVQEGFREIATRENDLQLQPWPPRMFELLVFGSVARGASEVGDIDMVLLDNGTLSSLALGGLDLHGAEEDLPDPATFLPESGRSNILRFGTEWLLQIWFDIKDERFKSIRDVPVDLHFYPLGLITSPERRAGFTKRHRDSRFFKNVMSDVLVLEPSSIFSEKLPNAIGYFERKYRTVMSDLYDA